MPSALFETSDRPGPWGAGPGPEPQPDPQDERPAREPVFNNGAWYVLALVAVILGGYLLQERLPPGLLNSLVFAPADLEHGRWHTALTAVFLHGNLMHALLNAGFILAFGTPVARFLGLGGRGAIAFFGFYLVTGVLANLAFAAVHWGSQAGLVGASGAASGLMAAAARIVAGQGRLGPILSRFVIAMGGAWIGINALIALVMLSFGPALLPGTQGAGIAWEAHVAGFLIGLFAIIPFARMAGR